MPVFISYSHRDSDFVDRLAANLVAAKHNVWVDRWELRVGDSLVQRVQDAIESASALLVVLSRHSVDSEWCKKELNTGLVRELDEKRVVVLPLLIEECAIPLFLRDKKFADFRDDFDSGLREVIEAISGVTSEGLGRLQEPEWTIDWAHNWGFERNGNFRIRLTLVEHPTDVPNTVLAEILIRANPAATGRYRQYEEEGLGFVGRLVILAAVREMLVQRGLRVILSDERPHQDTIELRDAKSGNVYTVSVTCRRLGEDTGRDLLIHLETHISDIIIQLMRRSRRLTPEESQRIRDKLKVRRWPGPPDPSGQTS